jgi:hypothetical protein
VSLGAVEYRPVTSDVVCGDEHVVGRHFLGVIPYPHHGIELPDGTLCENSPPGVRITSYPDFACGRPTRVTNPDATAADRTVAVQRALSRVGERRYSLTGNNCEHFATWCAAGIAVSQQVIEWIRALFRIALAVTGTVFTVALAQAALAE